MSKKLLKKIRLLEPIEEYKVGEYWVIHACMFVFEGDIEIAQAKRLLTQYRDTVEPEYAPEEEFGWISRPITKKARRARH